MLKFLVTDGTQDKNEWFDSVEIARPRGIVVTCSPVNAACRVKIQRVRRITQYQYREGKKKIHWQLYRFKGAGIIEQQEGGEILLKNGEGIWRRDSAWKALRFSLVSVENIEGYQPNPSQQKSYPPEAIAIGDAMHSSGCGAWLR